MGGVTIREYGLSFVWVCLKNYIGRSWPILAIFLAGIIISVIVTGSVLITTVNNSGMYFENTAVQSLSSVIKLMAVFSSAFLPFFMKIGGLLF